MAITSSSFCILYKCNQLWQTYGTGINNPLRSNCFCFSRVLALLFQNKCRSLVIDRMRLLQLVKDKNLALEQKKVKNHSSTTLLKKYRFPVLTYYIYFAGCSDNRFLSIYLLIGDPGTATLTTGLSRYYGRHLHSFNGLRVALRRAFL